MENIASTNRHSDGEMNRLRGLSIPDMDSFSANSTGLQHLQFDAQGMLLPHSIRSSLEDFKSHLKAKGLTNLVKRIQWPVRDPLLEGEGQLSSKAVEEEIPSMVGNKETNALQQWNTEMRHRRKQQNILSGVLNRPVGNLLMNRGNSFRDTQERRELLNQTLPFIQPGYGVHVGGEFWSLPQLLGDEFSGITTTLTQTERGRREPVTHVGQPNSIRQETGLFCTETLQPEPQARHQRSYLQQQFQRIEEVFPEKDTKKPYLSQLEVVGSCQAVEVCHSPTMNQEEDESERKQQKNDNDDRLVELDDAHPNALEIPALRFCGQLASWTGNSTTIQGLEGISGLIIFETLTGETASAKTELHNEGNTAIFFGWKKLPVKQTFSSRSSQTIKSPFYFSSSGGVINPGDTQSVEFIFQSEEPGIKTELWQLKTHPVLLQGAPLQVTLKGIAVLKDTTAEQRLFIQNKLEKIVAKKVCQMTLDEILQDVHSPERPSSPVELYLTEEQQFLQKNPKIQFFHQPVQSLKGLWDQVSPGEETWDLSVDTLRQAILTLPDEKSNQSSPSREEGLAQLNYLYLQLCEPSPVKHHLTARTIGQQMMRNLLDSGADEAMLLRNLLELPEIETWTEDCNESIISDTDNDINKEEGEQTGKTAETSNGGRAKLKKNSSKVEPRSSGVHKSVEVSKRSTKRENDEKKGKESSNKLPDVEEVDPEVWRLYTQLLRQKIYTLMEDFVDNLCDLTDEVNTENSHCI